MSIGKFKKDELRSIADELKLVVPDNAKVLDLRELIQESEIYKNDKETYQAIVDCVLEEINDRRNENENRLEIEKIKLSQLEKELEIAKLHNQSGKSLPLQNENQLITTECNIESKIDVLLGAEIFYELLRPGQIYCGDSRLLLQNTVFGYVVSGSVGDENRLVSKTRIVCSEEDVSFEMFKQRVHFKNGRYEVELPWKRDSNELSDNFSLEKRRLGSLMRKMQRDKVLYSEYFSVSLAATIKTHIGKYMEKYPDTVRTLDHCFYVDDLVTGEDDAKSAFDLSSKAAKIMSEAGMNLRKWISK
ncbi:DUF1758 domain-containing protein [Trichonephila clavipes]|uniref:DUF1758 domain-containing protein n=1 Tax=Trichonephila clavipes TaxID=2585209 RepID=A0A8X7BFG2_TRICX|nr:DUF1758 domain-containing protein [Trichonephila clavipes]